MSTHPVDKIVGENLRLHRVSQGLTQSALGKKIGLASQQIQKYESGKNRISASILAELAIALDVPTARFFDGIEGLPESEPKSVTANLSTPMASQEGLSLLTSYFSIDDKDIRASILFLVKTIANGQSLDSLNRGPTTQVERSKTDPAK